VQIRMVSRMILRNVKKIIDRFIFYYTIIHDTLNIRWVLPFKSTNTTLLHSTSSSKSLLFLKLIGVSIVYSYPFQF